MFVMRYDADASVKRWANAAWKVAGGAPKLQKEILPAIEKFCVRMRAGELGLGMQKIAAKVVEELTKAGEMEASSVEEAQGVARFNLAPPADRDADSVEAKIASGQALENVRGSTDGVSQLQGDDQAKDLFTAHAAFSALPAEIIAHCNAVAQSVIVEGLKKKCAGPKMASAIAAELEGVLKHSECNPADMKLEEVSEAVARAKLGDAFDAKGGAGDDDSEVLLRVENLLLMYGGGKMLLKDTVLEMRKNCCYGVVGQNGAGKTTLMKEIAGHKIVGMPQELKCVHVDDSKLGLMSSSTLSVVEYCIKMAKDIGVEIALDGAKDTLKSVGFDETKMDDPVAETSTGWRMRLTLAVSMLKHADLVLLDEPTNHLDEQSVEWLGDYINSIKSASVMVISHEPKFLDRICTHIMAYVDKKLEYP